MVKRSEWMRNDRWDEAEQRAFFQRLERSRGAFHRIQHLNCKAHFLKETGDPPKIEAAVQLYQKVCREAEEEAQKLPPNEAGQYILWAVNALADIGHMREKQGRVDEAIVHYREALRRQEGKPPGFYITRLAGAVYKTNRVTEFAEVLDLLDRSWKRYEEELLVFRQLFFEYGFYQAVLSLAIGRIEAAKAYARGIRTILAAPDHGIGQSMSLGTIRATAEERAEIQRILDLPESEAKPSGKGIIDFLNSLPPGTRSKEDIDQQIREERDSWGDR